MRSWHGGAPGGSLPVRDLGSHLDFGQGLLSTYDPLCSWCHALSDIPSPCAVVGFQLEESMGKCHGSALCSQLCKVAGQGCRDSWVHAGHSRQQAHALNIGPAGPGQSCCLRAKPGDRPGQASTFFLSLHG